jgi:hypothetical protein
VGDAAHGEVGLGFQDHRESFGERRVAVGEHEPDYLPHGEPPSTAGPVWWHTARVRRPDRQETQENCIGGTA